MYDAFNDRVFQVEQQDRDDCFMSLYGMFIAAIGGDLLEFIEGEAGDGVAEDLKLGLPALSEEELIVVFDIIDASIEKLKTDLFDNVEKNFTLKPEERMSLVKGYLNEVIGDILSATHPPLRWNASFQYCELKHAL